MALGNQNSPQSNRKLLILKLKSKDANDQSLIPNQFQISEKVGDKWVPRDKLEARVSGNLTKMELGSGEYNKKKYGTVKLYLEDTAADEMYLLDLRYNQLSRSLFNSLLALESFSDVSISNYKSTGKDGKEYANISLWQGNKMVKGKFALADIPKPDVIKNKAGEVVQRDFSEVDTFFEKHLAEFAPKVTSSK